MRGTRGGYTNFGKIQIPFLPQGIVLTDRDDGTLWLLTHNLTEASADDTGHIAITDTIPSNINYRTYSADSGPVFGSNPTIRLILRGGNLGYETYSLSGYTTDIDQPPVQTRRGNQHWTNEIIIPTSWQRFPNMLGWTPMEL